MRPLRMAWVLPGVPSERSHCQVPLCGHWNTRSFGSDMQVPSIPIATLAMGRYIKQWTHPAGIFFDFFHQKLTPVETPAFRPQRRQYHSACPPA